MHPKAPTLDGYIKEEKSLKPEGILEIFTTSFGRRSLILVLVLILLSELLAPIGLVEVGIAFINDWQQSPAELLTTGGIVFAGIQTTKLIHEGIHWSLFRHYGHSPNIDWNWFGGVTYISDEIIEWSESIIILLGPLLLISPPALAAAVFAPNWSLMLYLSTIFYWNTCGSINDITTITYTVGHPSEMKYWAIMDDGELINVWYWPDDA